MTEPTARLHVRDAGPAPGVLAGFEVLRSDPLPWLLDSSRPDARLGRFSFAGADPWAVVRARGRALEVEVRRGVHPGWAPGLHRREGDPFGLLRELVPDRAEGAASALPFSGGAVGWFGYELAEQLEPVRLRPAQPGTLPDLVFLLVDALLAFDHGRGRLALCGLGFGPEAERMARERVDQLARRIAPGARPPQGPVASRRPPGPRPIRARHDAAAYAALVRQVKGHIAEGDLYQACLTHRLDVLFDGDPWALYQRLRRENPAPFAAYLALPEGCVLSSSPERFLRVDARGEVEARPIKGTRVVGMTAASAEASRRALAASDKDRAENVMIVDLYRNDLGRVCRPGSVRVPELFAIERHGGLHQMVSTVRGRLRPDRDRLDLVRAAFPPGSMTGAPKIAAMRLLADLEPLRRGVYAGALGFLDARGGMDLSVVIRTILLSPGEAHVHVGGGIVADSGPHAEYQESMDKARPLLAALEATPEPPACAETPRRVPVDAASLPGPEA